MKFHEILNQIPESISEFIDRYDLLITNEEFVEIIGNYAYSEPMDIVCYFFDDYDSISVLNELFKVKFLPKYGKIYEEQCKRIIEKFPSRIIYVLEQYFSR